MNCEIFLYLMYLYVNIHLALITHLVRNTALLEGLGEMNALSW